MSVRKLLAAAVIVPLVAGMGAADAAPKKKKPPAKKPVCNLYRGTPGGGGNTPVGVALPEDPNLDLLSADVATDATRVTAVWRLKDVNDNTQTNWPGGRGYQLVFTIHGVANTLQAKIPYTGDPVWQDGKGKGVIDATKNEIRMTVNIADLKEKFKPNEKLALVDAHSWRWVHTTSITLGRVDVAQAAPPASYVATWPSCVRVGL